MSSVPMFDKHSIFTSVGNCYVQDNGRLMRERWRYLATIGQALVNHWHTHSIIGKPSGGREISC